MGIYLQSDSEITDAIGCKIEIVEKKMMKNHKTASERSVKQIKERSNWMEGRSAKTKITIEELFASKDRLFPDGEVLIKVEFFVECVEMTFENFVIENLNVQNKEPTIATVSNEFFDRFVHQQEN